MKMFFQEGWRYQLTFIDSQYYEKSLYFPQIENISLKLLYITIQYSGNDIKLDVKLLSLFLSSC